GRAFETVEEKIERLAFKEKQKTERLKECIQDQYYSQFEFKPKTNPISNIIATPTPFEELVKNEHSKAVKEGVREVLQHEFREKHPFKPKLIAKQFGNGQSVIDRIQQAAELAAEREKKLARMRDLQRYEELKACSFKPVVNQYVPVQKGPIVIRGLGRYLDRVEKARSMKKQQQST